MPDQISDRNFDDIADHFEKRIHNSSKGKLRQAVIWRDLQKSLPQIEEKKTLKILDLGAGLGYFTTKLAQLGHTVVCNDLSEKMIKKAQAAAKTEHVFDQIQWHVSSYQNLIDQLAGDFDLILCHALLEWLEKPEELIPNLTTLLKPGGSLSLCFYNPAGITFRNLIKGNFDWIKNQQEYTANNKSLTPNNACSMEEVQSWLARSKFTIKSTSGIRVFSDYTINKRGGLNSPEAVHELEIEYSDQEPYKRLGRYLHIIASLN